MYYCIKGGLTINPPNPNEDEIMKQFSEIPIVDHDFQLGTDIPAKEPDVPPQTPATEAQPESTPEPAAQPPQVPEAAASPDASVMTEEATTHEAPPVRLSELPVADHSFPLETDEPVKLPDMQPTAPAAEAQPESTPEPAVQQPPVLEAPVNPDASVTTEEATHEAPPVRLSELPVTDHSFPLETDEPVKLPDTQPTAPAADAQPESTKPAALLPQVPEAAASMDASVMTEEATTHEVPPVRLSELPVTDHSFPLETDEPVKLPDTQPTAPAAEAQPESTSQPAVLQPQISETAAKPDTLIMKKEATMADEMKPVRLSEMPVADHNFPLATDHSVMPPDKRKANLLDARTIPKFMSQLVKPPVFVPVKESGDDDNRLFVVDICEFRQQVLPEGYPETTVWGYGGRAMDAAGGCPKYVRSSPGPTFDAIRNVPVRVKWVNKLTGSHLFAVDPTLHWANPNGMPMDPPQPWPAFPVGFPEAQAPVPTVTHLHGGETPSVFDGHPDAWFTSDGKKGPAYRTSVYTYPNSQEPTTLWYHDHALGLTRLNVYAGLAGFYLLRDVEELYGKKYLPKGNYEIPIVIQDRSFNSDGSLAYPSEGVNPDIHPYWVPEFFGDTIMVNGKVWPNLNVERRLYRFRLLNGSNARFYNLRLSNGMSFTQVGSDGGFLPQPVELTSLLLAPAERADILVDFSGLKPGTHVTLLNDANTPYPDGDPPDPETTGQIMRFTVPARDAGPVRPPKLPAALNVIPCLKPDTPQRVLTLNEVQGPDGPVMVLLNGQRWEAPISEIPVVGSTEEWVIANLTMDTHPIHLHLIQFLLKDRQDFAVDAYMKKWQLFNGMPPLNHRTYPIPVEPYLIGCPIPPDPNETGWKDTVRMNPMQVTRILVRFAPQKAKVSRPHLNLFPFDPTVGPGYVWHCHILDHEDNDMMRPYIIRF